MRTRALVPVAVAALALAGCGDHALVLRVDLLSYVDPALRTVAFGPIPAAPGGLATGEQVLVDDVTVNLVGGLEGVTEAEAVELTMAVIARDSTGSGTDTLRLYASDEATEPLATPPAVVQVLTLLPGVTDTVVTTVTADRRVAELFVQRRMRIGVTASARGPESGEPLVGSLELSALQAVVIAGRKTP